MASGKKRKQAGEILSVANKHDERAKRVKTEVNILHDEEKVDVEKSVSQLQIVAALLTDLFECIFDAKWEVRHGALLALRHILLSSRFIQSIDTTKNTLDEAEIVNKWVEECLVRCCSVLALDQFVDYSADESVAPVREVCAQVFGILLGSLSQELVLVEYIEALRCLLSDSMWHACHGGLLGLKYLIQAHKNHAARLIPLVFDEVLSAFCQRHVEEEDILVVAAGMLEDFTHFLVNVPVGKVHLAARFLWRTLKHKKGSGMVHAAAIRALSMWYNDSSVCSILANDSEGFDMTWSNVIRAVPLLHQHSHVVRRSTVNCIAALFTGGMFRASNNSANLDGLLRFLLPRMLLQLLREQEQDVRQSILHAWKQVVEQSFIHGLLLPVLTGVILRWMELLWSIEGLPCLYIQAADVGICDDICEDSFPWDNQRSLEANVKDNMKSRVAFADAIGFVCSYVPLHSSCFDEIIRTYEEALHSSLAERQCGSLLALSRWAQYEKHKDLERLVYLRNRIGVIIDAYAKRNWLLENTSEESNPNQLLMYHEHLGSLSRVRKMEERIITIFKVAGVILKTDTNYSSTLSAASISRDIAERVASFPYERLRGNPEQYELAHFKRQDLFLVDELLQQNFSRYYNRIQGLGSCVYCSLLPLPTKKSGFLVKSLMESIKKEECVEFLVVSAETMADFVLSQASIQRKCVAKIIANLNNNATAMTPTALMDNMSSDVKKSIETRVRGAELTFLKICERGGNQIFQKCPFLESIIKDPWNELSSNDQALQKSMHMVCLLVPSIHPEAMHHCVQWLESIAHLVLRSYWTEETMNALANAIGTICKSSKKLQEEAMLVVFQTVFVVFTKSMQADRRTILGAVVVLHKIATSLGNAITPYIPSLVHFAMMTMSTQDVATRTLAARAFAEIVPLISLQMDLVSSKGDEDSCDVKSVALTEVLRQNQVSRKFLENLLEGKAIEHVDVKELFANGDIALRSYQKHGVDWLVFLARNNLHGVLADDMGLGKTMQTLAAVAKWLVDYHQINKSSCPCLVVCPPIIVHHWISEATKVFSSVFGSIVDYSVSATERKLLHRRNIFSKNKTPTLIVTTYSILRSDVDVLKKTEFSFVVLDEAHLIRNPKTAIFEAVCSLQSAHRLALSGTPLQNNVADLWSLFEFLMPGYLGDFASFRRDFVSPISNSKENSATSKQKEIAALSITQLHQKVLPFILRRTKDQVLTELPPKIVTHILLALSPLQRRLYLLASASDYGTEGGSTNAVNAPDVLSNLQLLRKICVHPGFVENASIVNQLRASEKTNLREWESSGKFVGLRDILVDSCNMGHGENLISKEEVLVSEHRCLVFAQLKETLDFTESMLQKALPHVTYRRLDGGTPHNKRAHIVNQFNNDPSIDLLLLTTAVGGLGLTLTGADTVIFLEHSWNPFVDLQAMDRAHRLGQKKTVRVFRLIMKDSLEDHIMNLQGFKERVATTVVSKSDVNDSMNTNTTQVLHLLKSSSSVLKAQETAMSTVTSESEDILLIPQSACAVLDQIGELWDETQYDSLAFPVADDAEIDA